MVRGDIASCEPSPTCGVAGLPPPVTPSMEAEREKACFFFIKEIGWSVGSARGFAKQVFFNSRGVI